VTSGWPAGLDLLQAEKELTRRSDELARRRQELPCVSHPEQFGSELTQVQVASAEQSAIVRMAPQVLGSVPSARTQQGGARR
jgi:hypothetical protein